MCIVIDVNVLSSVFQKDDANHDNFAPVLDWIYNGKGKIVYGGTKYLEEIPLKYLRIFTSFNKAGKAKFIANDIVDAECRFAEASISHPDFDDPHLIGLLRASKCRLICSLDSRAYPYFRHSLFFSPAKDKPRIYSSKANKNLLSDRFIAGVCLPCMPTTNSQREMLGSI